MIRHAVLITGAVAALSLAALSSAAQAQDKGQGPGFHAAVLDYLRQKSADTSASAEQGDAGAQYNLGVMYRDGEGVPQDDGEAVAWFRKAAEQGHAQAQFTLGLMYATGDGVPQDFAEAVTWYRKVAAQGYDGAQHNLGVMYESGEGVPQDYSEAVTCRKIIPKRSPGSVKLPSRGTPARSTTSG